MTPPPPDLGNDPGPEPDPNIHAGGLCESWGALARVCAAEALGTALLVLLASAPSALAPHLAPLQAGLTVAMLVQLFGDISGAQLNPCVSVAALVCGRMRCVRAAAEVGAQLCGAACGAAALALCLAREPAAALTLPAPGFPVYKALCVEALCGACVVLANCAQWARAAGEGGGDSWPLRIGATVAALAASASPLTGASMNPARSFGPALVAGCWRQHWIYWAGPLSGAGTAAALHCVVWRAPRPRPAPAPHPRLKL